MDVDIQPRLADALTLLGALAVVVGTWLPWIVHSPGADLVIQIYVPGMETGIATPDYAVLGVLAVGLAAATITRHERRGGYAAAATGGLVVVMTVGYLVATLTGGGVTFRAFVPGPGAVLTVLGGLGLVAAGWRHLAATVDDRGATGRTETPG